MPVTYLQGVIYFRISTLLCFALLLNVACTTVSGHREWPGIGISDTAIRPFPPGKINGVSLVATPRPLTGDFILPLQEHHVNWISVIPYGMSRPGGEKLYFNMPGQWWGESPEGVRMQVRAAHDQGIRVLLKPQLWILDGAFTGLFMPSDLEKWFQDYVAFLLLYADVAEKEGVDMFCIGTELQTVIQAAPEKWEYLIREVRKVYHGPLTYAANWDEVSHVPFWKQLDIIGVDAYFPLVHKRSPTTAELKEAWAPILDSLRQMSIATGRPLCFTEYGYRSVDFSAGRQWELGNVWDEASPNPELQARAYTALFQTFWPESWFRGGFCWKWYPDAQAFEGNPAFDFTPQDKPAADTLQMYYSRFSVAPENNSR